MIKWTHVSSHAEAFFCKIQLIVKLQITKLLNYKSGKKGLTGYPTIIVTASLSLLRWGSTIIRSAIHRGLGTEVRPAFIGSTMMMSWGDHCNGAAHCWIGEEGRCCSRNKHRWGVDVPALWPVRSIVFILELPRFSVCGHTRTSPLIECKYLHSELSRLSMQHNSDETHSQWCYSSVYSYLGSCF